jgi:hypothetical protein
MAHRRNKRQQDGDQAGHHRQLHLLGHSGLSAAVGLDYSCRFLCEDSLRSLVSRGPWGQHLPRGERTVLRTVGLTPGAA